LDNKYLKFPGLFFVLLALLASELPANESPLWVGGALRVNYVYKDWDDAWGDLGEFAFDTARINMNWTDDVLIGSLEYRYYRDKHADGHDYHMLHHGWVGVRIDDQQQMQAGVQKVPFGILPYASHNWFFQLGYYVGLEDDYDMGIKYMKVSDDWDVQLAWYARDEGSWSGESDDSARYSYDLVREGTNGNREKNQFNVRVTRTLAQSNNRKVILGFSLQHGSVTNRNTGKTGDQSALAVHLNANWSRWNLMLQGAKYTNDVNNDPLLDASPDGRFVVMGAYDAAYHVASDGGLYSVGIAYSLPVILGPVSNLTFYNDYSLLKKSHASFSDTRQNVLGMSISAGKFYTYVDIASGKNHPWLGGDWVNGLAAGVTGDGWHTRFNINVGYYF